MVPMIIAGSLVIAISGTIFAASLPLILLPEPQGNLITLALLGSLVTTFCLRDLLSRGRVIRGITRLCIILCLPAVLASSEMEWLHAAAEQCWLIFRVRLNPSLLVALLTLVTAGCIFLQVQARGRELHRELWLREAKADEAATAFAWQTGAVLVILALSGLLVTLFLAGQNLALVKRLTNAVTDRLSPSLTVLAGVTLLVLIVGAYLVETRETVSDRNQRP